MTASRFSGSSAARIERSGTTRDDPLEVYLRAAITQLASKSPRQSSVRPEPGRATLAQQRVLAPLPHGAAAHPGLVTASSGGIVGVGKPRAASLELAGSPSRGPEGPHA